VILIAFVNAKTYLCIQNHIIMLVSELGETIKNRRKELGITQPHLAELAEVSTNTLYKLERGQGNPSLEVLNKLADVLGMELIFEVKNLPADKAGKH
jgi:y4mF family transcriptional regulator